MISPRIAGIFDSRIRPFSAVRIGRICMANHISLNPFDAVNAEHPIGDVTFLLRLQYTSLQKTTFVISFLGQISPA